MNPDPKTTQDVMDGFLWLVVQTAALPSLSLLLGFALGWRCRAAKAKQAPSSAGTDERQN